MPPEPDDSSNVNDTPPDAETALNNKLNAVVSSHMKRLIEKQLPGILGPMFESALKPIHEKLAAPPPSDDESGKAKGKKADASPEFQALQAKLTDWENKYAAAETARLTAEKKSRDDKAQNELRAALQPHVKSDLLDILSDHLYKNKGVVDFEEDGTPVFRSKKTDSWGAEEEVRLPLKAGVEQFLKSPDAKPFLPAPGSSSAAPVKKPMTQGGQSQGQPDLEKMTDEQKVRRSMELAEKYKQR